MKKYPIQSHHLLCTLFLVITLAACGGGDDQEKEAPEPTDNTIAYNISAIDNQQFTRDIMFTRVDGDPEDGIEIRKKVDSGTHHERTLRGTVLRGTYINNNRAFIYSVYNSDSGCNESAWYSWVNPAVEVTTLGGTFSEKEVDETFTAATGLEFGFGRWNKDYQQRWADSVDSVRRANGAPPTPTISPNDSLRDGKPYATFPTPEGDGFLDAPFFGDRTADGGNSLAERLLKELGRVPRRIRSRTAPPNDTGVIRFTTRGITYLYCIDRGPVCLGFYNWRVVETDTVYITWVEDPNATPELGMNARKRWIPGTTIATGSRATVGPWRRCP